MYKIDNCISVLNDNEIIVNASFEHRLYDDKMEKTFLIDLNNIDIDNEKTIEQILNHWGGIRDYYLIAYKCNLGTEKTPLWIEKTF